MTWRTERLLLKRLSILPQTKLKMPALHQATKIQPWKACWPPKQELQRSLKFTGLGYSKGEKIVMDGNSASSSIALSSKEWKEHNVVTVSEEHS